MITGTIKRYKNERANRFRGLHVPRQHVERMNLLSKLMAEHNVDELTAEIIAESGISEEEAGKLILSIVSKDQPIELDSGETVSFEEVITNTTDSYLEIESQSLVESIINILQNKLTQYEFDIFEEIYYTYTVGGEKVDRKDIARRYKCSVANVGRVVRKIRSLISQALIKLEQSN